MCSCAAEPIPQATSLLPLCCTLSHHPTIPPIPALPYLAFDAPLHPRNSAHDTAAALFVRFLLLSRPCPLLCTAPAAPPGAARRLLRPCRCSTAILLAWVAAAAAARRPPLRFAAMEGRHPHPHVRVRNGRLRVRGGTHAAECRIARFLRQAGGRAVGARAASAAAARRGGMNLAARAERGCATCCHKRWQRYGREACGCP